MSLIRIGFNCIRREFRLGLTIFKVFMIFCIVFFALGCNKLEDDEGSDAPAFYAYNSGAVVVTQASDWSSAAHSIITMDKPRQATNDLSPSGNSDVIVDAYGDFFYLIERTDANSITRYRIDNPDTVITQFAVENVGDITPANVHDMVFINETKAYLICYDYSKIWIVNPLADSAADFKIGEIDISAYGDSDNIPEADRGIIINGKLFITMQRLNRDNWFSADNPSYVAVFDVATDEEIDTGQGSDGRKGIELSVRNPYSNLEYSNGFIYLAAVGDWAGNYSGIQRINASNYEVDASVIHEDHITTDVAIVSSTIGYFIDYVNWGNMRLRSFNPSSKEIDTDNVGKIGDSLDWNLEDIAVDSSGNLWVSDRSINHAGIYVIDPSTNEIEEGPISTNLYPGMIVFCTSTIVY